MQVSAKAFSFFRSVQHRLGVQSKTIPRDVCTRWTTSEKLLRTVLTREIGSISRIKLLCCFIFVCKFAQWGLPAKIKSGGYRRMGVPV